MNFKLNAFIAATLLAAGSANAAIAPNAVADGATNGNGELILVVTDTTAGYSFVADLGVTFDGFSGGTSNTWNLSGYSAWTPYVSAIGGSLVNATYAVYGFDNVGTLSTGSNSLRLLTTVATGDDISGAAGNYYTSNSKLGNAVGTSVSTQWVQAVQKDNENLSNDHDTVLNGSSYSNKPAAFSTLAIGDSLQANTQFVTMVAANGTADFWLLGNNGSKVLDQANTSMLAGQFSLDGTSLNYAVAAVPEAETYALMLSGLGLVAFMVRRRNKV